VGITSTISSNPYKRIIVVMPTPATFKTIIGVRDDVLVSRSIHDHWIYWIIKPIFLPCLLADTAAGAPGPDLLVYEFPIPSTGIYKRLFSNGGADLQSISVGITAARIAAEPDVCVHVLTYAP
jgi:hypothetical protein